MAKILIVEDEPQVSDPIQEFLTLEGHQIEIARDGNDALQLLLSFPFELVILDWNLPGLSGPEILKRFRGEGGHAQVIFLTGNSDLQSKMTGLDAGADDYLAKPIDLQELSARVRSRLRRPGQFQPLVKNIGGVGLDANTKKVTVDDKLVYFTNREFAILEFLFRHPDTPYSARALRDNIWSSDSEVLEDTVRVAIQLVRRKLGTRADILQTIPGSGYQITTQIT